MGLGFLRNAIDATGAHSSGAAPPPGSIREVRGCVHRAPQYPCASAERQLLRFAAIPITSRPRPSSASVPGSGTDATFVAATADPQTRELPDAASVRSQVIMTRYPSSARAGQALPASLLLSLRGNPSIFRTTRGYRGGTDANTMSYGPRHNTGTVRGHDGVKKADARPTTICSRRRRADGDRA
jgi:hypothetical protein